MQDPRVSQSVSQFSSSVVLDSLLPQGLQHPRVPCPSPTHKACLNLCHWVGDTISFSVFPFSSHLQSFQASGSFQMSQFFSSEGQSIGPFNGQHQTFWWIFRTDFLWYWQVWSPSPRESQKSSPTPQLKSINYSELSCLFSPALTSIHDYWKNHNFD